MAYRASPYTEKVITKVRPKSSPVATVMAHLVTLLRRNNKLRRRVVFSVIAFFTVTSLIIGRKHTRTASTLSSYIPGLSRALSDAILRYDEDRYSGQFEAAEIENGSIPGNSRPKFHLLIPVHDGGAPLSLCKTILSAAILDYPPPILLHHSGKSGTNAEAGADAVEMISEFLGGREASEDDLVMIAEPDTYFQLPASMMLSRFHSILDTSNSKLLKYYKNTRITFNQNIFFAARTTCPDGSSTCFSPDSQHFLSSSLLLGPVSSLRPLFAHASELSQSPTLTTNTTQQIMALIFAEQEKARGCQLPSKWLTSWRRKALESKCGREAVGEEGQKAEFGIGLDVLHSLSYNADREEPSKETGKGGWRFMKSEKGNLLAGKKGTRFPKDLAELEGGPWGMYQVPEKSSEEGDRVYNPLDHMPAGIESLAWKDVELAIVQGSGKGTDSVPATIKGEKEIWEKMWFHNHTRALLRQYWRFQAHIQAHLSVDEGDYTDRGGKGGLWTQKGEWKEWSDVCTTGEEFGDGKGPFGREKVEDGGKQAACNSFGTLISGQPTEGEGLREPRGEWKKIYGGTTDNEVKKSEDEKEEKAREMSEESDATMKAGMEVDTAEPLKQKQNMED